MLAKPAVRVRRLQDATAANGIGVILHVVTTFWRQISVVGVLSGIVVLTQAAVVTLVMASVGAPAPLPEPATEVLADLRRQSTLYFPVLILVLGSLSAGAMYLVRGISVGLMVRYERLCAKRVLSRLREEEAALERLSDGNVLTLLSKDCRFGGRIAFELTNAVFPIGVSLVAFPILLYLNAAATMTLIVVVLIFAFGQLLLRPTVHRLSRGMETHALLDKQNKAAALKAMRLRKKTDLDALLGDVPNPVFMETYRRRLLMPHVGNMIGGLQVTLALAVAVFWFPDSSTAGDSLSVLVLFLAIALFVLSQLQTLYKVFVNFHIFNTYFHRAFLVMQGKQVQFDRAAPPRSEPDSGETLDEP